MKLSIVIPTYNRLTLLQQTVETILPQLNAEVELLIVDASFEHSFSIQHKYVRCIKGKAESFDEAYEEAVAQAKGDWVWLFSDDDWIKAGAIDVVLKALVDGVDLLVLNAEVLDSKMEKVLKPRWLIQGDRTYGERDYNQMFADVGDLGTFVGSLVIRRVVWETRIRNAQRYFGMRFITFVVPFMKPTKVRYVSYIAVSVRFGHQDWIRKCSQLIGRTLADIVWSFPLESWSKEKVRPRKPSLGELMLWHAVNSDVTHWSSVISAIPRVPLRWACRVMLKLTGKSGGISDYMLQKS